MIELIKKVQKARDLLVDDKNNLIASYSNWDKGRDARITLFSKCINTLNSTQLGMTFIYFHLTQKQSWNSVAHKTILDNDIQIYVNEFVMFVKIGFIHSLFSSIESSFRLILKALDPNVCSGGTAEFKGIYSCLLTRLGLNKWEVLLDLLRNIRNTIHNNGVYFHRSGRNETVSYNGNTYSFDIGKPVDFVTWDFLLDLLNDIDKMFVEVVSHRDVVAISMIIDPFAPLIVNIT
jgi:hypothetical protein